MTRAIETRHAPILETDSVWKPPILPPIVPEFTITNATPENKVSEVDQAITSIQALLDRASDKTTAGILNHMMHVHRDTALLETLKEGTPQATEVNRRIHERKSRLDTIASMSDGYALTRFRSTVGAVRRLHGALREDSSYPSASEATATELKKLLTDHKDQNTNNNPTTVVYLRSKN